jgi:DNA-binding response OmpR family regulator
VQPGDRQEFDRLLRAGEPDLLVLDAQLSDASGFDLCRRLRMY